MSDARALFDQIPPSQHGSEPVLFVNHDLHDSYYPPVYTIDGNELKLEGPVRVTEIRRRKRIRFVRVDFFQWRPTPTGTAIPQKYASSYAWQGEHALHLLEQFSVMDNDPFAEDEDEDTLPSFLDKTHERLMKLQGERDIHLDIL